MSLQPTRLMTIPCSIVKRVPGGTDRYGGAVMTETSTATRCWYSSPTTEEREGQVFQAITAYFAPDADLDNVARVSIDGVGVFEVDGSPLAHRSPRTQVPTHITVRLKRGA